MPAGTVDVAEGGEWSFAQTLWHLIMAAETWLCRAIPEIQQPFHPVGQPSVEYETDGGDMSIITTLTPSYAEVLQVRAARVTLGRDFLVNVTSDELAATRKNPWDPHYPETTLSNMHVTFNKQWEHHRYARRDLEGIETAGE